MATLLERMPRGARLTPESWAARHRIIVRLLWLHVPALVLVGLAGPRRLSETLLLAAVVALFALGGTMPKSQTLQASLTSLGLIASTFVAIELTGGRVDSHLHLYAILIFIAVYQQWAPLLWAVAVVVVHHGVLGLIEPERVFGMHIGTGEAVIMVAIHAGAAVLEVAGILLFWHFAEQAERESEAAIRSAEQARLDLERADQQAREEAHQAERTQAAQIEAQARRLAQDAAEVAGGARVAIEAVVAVDHELANLATAVHDIARRSSQAAEIATSGSRVAADATDRMHGLQRSVTEIAEVNALIAQLAGQTNLLSLNATIEAARAGEMGKGFAVVASEVKQLANETAASASKVTDVIDAITEQTQAAAGGFASTAAAVAEINEVQTDIAASVEEQSAVLAEVTRQLSTASQAANEIVTGLDRLTANAQRN